MNQRGFFTIVGLCLLLVAAIFIKGVNEFETNYTHGITNFQFEHELQNAADSALITAVETGNTATQIFTSEKFGTITVKINLKKLSAEEELYLRRFGREYLSDDKIKDTPLNENNTRDTGNKNSSKDTTPEWFKTGNILMSVASCNNPFFEGKIYRRAFAYILTDDESKTIHFVNSL